MKKIDNSFMLFACCCCFIHFFRDETFDHMALIVDIENVNYLVDVGYGFPNQHFKPLEMSIQKTFKQVGC